MIVPLSTFSAALTVSKTGTAQYHSIQTAVDAAHPGDEIVILDTAVYEEMVTIDSTKNGLVLRSENPRAAARPTIVYKDTIHVKPTNASEALIDSLLDFDQNGALRVIGATGVLIEGITVDGGGVFPFGGDPIWEGRYSMQHGNSAIVVWQSGDVVIIDCEMRNAYFGISVKDRNEGGVFAHPNPSDVDIGNPIPFSTSGQTGNHLVEHCRIHNNSVGMFFESTWDMGSTIRYNLLYENHHPTAEMVTLVKKISVEGENQCGGAIMTKDMLLSPLAIYNNTFWHNSLLFIGNWKSGGHHLVFNNIFAEPDQYWQSSTTTFATSFDMSKCFANRMHNCVFAAQERKSTPNLTIITNDLKPAQTGGTYEEGALISPFPATAEVRWVEMTSDKFISVDPKNPDFLVPDWSNQLVAEYIVDKGWDVPGVKDPDGTRADLGALPQGAAGRLMW